MTETTDKPKVMSERALKTRAKIMDATRAFIVREGVGRLSIDKIVKESGTSKGAFLYHFKNRKALFCALVEEYVDHLNERMNAHMGKYQNSEEPLILGYA
ncbi:TetR/AcrR family transcriptional regulator, partial [Parasutterella sp.]